jgi:hypothetical protein
MHHTQEDTPNYKEQLAAWNERKKEIGWWRRIMPGNSVWD